MWIKGKNKVVIVLSLSVLYISCLPLNAGGSDRGPALQLAKKDHHRHHNHHRHNGYWNNNFWLAPWWNFDYDWDYPYYYKHHRVIVPEW